MLSYDLGRGLRPLAGGDAERLQGMVQYLRRPARRARRPGRATPTPCCSLLDRLIERNLLEDDPAKRKSIGIIFDYAQYLVPAGDLGALARGQGTNLVRFLSWAQNPYIKRVNIAFCLVADKLAEVNDRLVQSPHVATIEVPLPDRAERERFCQWVARQRTSAKLTDFTPAQLAELSNGLSLVNLQRAARAGPAVRPAGRRRPVPAAQEDADRAAVPGPARVRRAAAHARPGRRPGGGQGAAARRTPS